MIRLKLGTVELLIDTPAEAAEVVFALEKLRGTPPQTAQPPSAIPLSQHAPTTSHPLATVNPRQVKLNQGKRHCACGKELLSKRAKMCPSCAREAKNAYMRDYMKRKGKKLNLEPQPVVPREDASEQRVRREGNRAAAALKGLK